MSQPRLSRVEKKQQTREAFLEAALRLAGERGSFSAVSLRDVAHEIGVVPTAIYRHFRDLDEVGLLLVAEAGAALRGVLHAVRTAGAPDVDMIQRSVSAYLAFAERHPMYVRLLASERVGTSPDLRRAVRGELDQCAREMARDLRDLDFLPNLSPKTLERACWLVVETMIGAAADLLDSVALDPAGRERHVEEFVFRLALVFRGAASWDDRQG